MIFGCNGPECWKSCRASQMALQKAFKTVYWPRRVLPEWEESRLTVAKN